MTLNDCDEDYQEPAIITDYIPADGFENQWILPPKVPDRKDSLPFIVQSYENGEKSEFKHRGYFVIFNHYKYAEDEKYACARRNGTQHDVNKLRKILMEIGFKVRVYDDCDKTETLEILAKYGNADCSECEMFGLALLTHGEDDGVVMTYSGDLNVKDYVDGIKCNRTLLKKPKLFFIQACRGSGYQSGWKIRQIIDGTDDPCKEKSAAWPLDADILVHYAQSEGYTSTRNPYWGSSFILGLVYYFKHIYRHELHDLLIRVNALVALRETCTGNPESDRKKQMPQLQSQLTKLLYFAPHKGYNTNLQKIQFKHDNVKVVDGVPMMVLGED